MSDTFRKEYKPLTLENQNLIRAIKEVAENIEILIGNIDNLEKTIAMINLEQCIMWSTKAIVLHDEKEN